jgi:hypothetical protein
MRNTIEIAREAGFTDGELAFMGDNFRRFAALVRADEREACAIVCMIEIGGMGDGYDCAAAIRARGNT